MPWKPVTGVYVTVWLVWSIAPSAPLSGSDRFGTDSVRVPPPGLGQVSGIETWVFSAVEAWTS